MEKSTDLVISSVAKVGYGRSNTDPDVYVKSSATKIMALGSFAPDLRAKIILLKHSATGEIE